MNGYAAEVTAITMLRAEVLRAEDVGVRAVELAVHGWRVFPLNGKIPAIPNPHPRGSLERQACKGGCGLPGHGVLDATTDIGQIEAWWLGAYRGANIGARVPDNAFVIDVDPRSGGGESARNLDATYGPLPKTLTAISGRGDGGSHRYFRRPLGKLTDKHLGVGIDIKTSAGYCVVPPSIHPDSRKPYRWVDVGVPIAEPPEWLIDLVRPPTPLPDTGEQIVRNVRNVRDGMPSWSRDLTVDWFSATTSWVDILVPHGWILVAGDGDADGSRWAHPAATSPWSATIRHSCLFCYSPNTPFEQTESGSPHGVTKFRAFAVLEHGGDLRAAASALITRRAF